VDPPVTGLEVRRAMQGHAACNVLASLRIGT
jgi:hypothetical protein